VVQRKGNTGGDDVREQIHQYHGKKIVSQYDDEKGTSNHVVHEIKGDGKVWQNSIQMGNHHAVSSILKKDCWENVGEFKNLAEAIRFAKQMPPKPEEPEVLKEGE
jgi:hypothetical protein